jgi:hypothetical protein
MKGLWPRLGAFGFSPAVLLGASLVVCGAADFYVATNGNNSNLGTIDQPFATLTRARDAARAVGTNTVRNIIIRGGKYYNVAVLLQREAAGDDSGLTIQGYPGEAAVLYGGMPLTNWASVSNGWYAATLPEFPNVEVTNASSLSDWQVRMLLVDGEMVDRAQYPTNTYSLYYSDRSGTTTMHYTNEDLGSWFVPTNAEIQIDYSWDQQTTGASAIDLANKAVTLSPTLRGDHGLNYTGVRSYRIYNIAQGMSRPGQFFYDRASRSVVLFPKGGKDPNTSECVVPTTTRVLYIKGRQYSHPWGITLSNLTIAVSTTDLELESDFGTYWDPMSLIYALYCENLTMDKLTLGRTAGNAIGMAYSYSTNTILRNSEIYNCGGGGAAIRIGPCILSNNFIHSIGNICYQSPGIRVSAGAIVTHNDIFDCKVEAIGDSYMAGCSIIYNHVSNCVQVLRDMGAFYTWHGYGNIVSSNLFERVVGVHENGADPRDWYRNAIYFDALTSNSVAQGNVVFDARDPIFLNIASSNAVINNMFVTTNDVVNIYAGGGFNNRFERNIVHSSSNLVVDRATNWNSFASNVFWSTCSPPLTNNVPAGATIADPLFKNISALDFGFQPGSAGPALGIWPITPKDIAQMGRIRPPVAPTNVHVRPPP